MEFLRVDGELIKASARWSDSATQGTSTKKHYAAWLAKIPEVQKNRYLLRLLEDDPMRVKTELLMRFQKIPSKPKLSAASDHNRTVGELLAISQSK